MSIYQLSVVLAMTISFSHAQQNIELSRYKVSNARQAVAAGKDHIYVISNDSIIKCDKKTGSIQIAFHDPVLKHLNSGIVNDGKLYCAHSNYPEIPMWGSIEIWDAESLEHIGNHSFGIAYGSCTWIDFYDDHYFVMFVHYSREGRRQKNRDVSWSQLVKFDKEWRHIEAWVLPPKLVERLQPYSLSGGVFVLDGRLICTHHHHQELYILSLPELGSELIWEETIATPIEGQGISLDEYEDNILWGITRDTREVLKTRLILN